MPSTAFDPAINGDALLPPSGTPVYDKFIRRRFNGRTVTQRASDGHFSRDDLNLVCLQPANDAEADQLWCSPYQALMLADQLRPDFVRPDFVKHLTGWIAEWHLEQGISMESYRHMALRNAVTAPSCPRGYFAIFQQTMPMFQTLIGLGITPSHKIVVDVSVGKRFRAEWESKNLANQYERSIQREAIYPDIYPQSASNPHHPHLYPCEALGYFENWLRTVYYRKFAPTYLKHLVRRDLITIEQKQAIEIVLKHI